MLLEALVGRLSFLLRSAKDLHDPVGIKVLSNALVSKLEAFAIAWSPYESTYILLLKSTKSVLKDSVQKIVRTLPLFIFH